MLNERRQMQIKGIKDGLLVTLGEGEWSELEAAFLAHVEDKAAFFKGARVAIDVGNHILRAAELGGLRDRLSSKGIALWAVISNSPVTEQTAQVLGLATRISTPRPERTIRPLDTNLPGDAQLGGRHIQRANHSTLIAARSRVDNPAQPAPDDHVAVGDHFRAGVHIAEHNHMTVMGNLEPRTKRALDKYSGFAFQVGIERTDGALGARC